MGKRSPIVHIEWRSRNVERLRDFYRTVFRWKFDETMPGYLMADTGSKNVGVGLLQIESGAPTQQGVVSFLASDDLGGTESAIREAGGQVIASSQPVPGWGRFSLFSDPDGNPLGLWQSEASVKLESKRAKKADKKRAKIAEQAAAPSDGDAGADAKRSKKAAKLKLKAEKLAAKAAEKAARKAQKQAKQAKSSKIDAAGADKPKVDKKSGKKADKKADKKSKSKKKDGITVGAEQ